ncbi:Fur family transcriptional regulator [Campylobacter majalis]|uniref:Fur family transcriptional regulator n=1 Tax=Campylobacter majalis TaxID=2790656 RepID=UPI003D69CEEF
MKMKKILKDNKIKVTPLRIKLLKILSQSDKPLSYDEILEQVRANKTSIYRAFEIFEKNNIIIKNEVGRKAFYELGSAAKAYFVCDVCHAMINIDLPLPNIAKSIKSAVIKGICKECE